MAEVDTSSYPKLGAVAPPNFLDTAGKYQQLQSNQIGIDQQKLKLYNDHFQIMNNELGTMAAMPGITKDVVLERMHRIGDTFNMPPAVRQQMEAEFKDANTPQQVQDKLNFVQRRGWDANQRINATYAAPGITPAQMNQATQVPNAVTGRTDTVPFQKFIADTGGNPNQMPGATPLPSNKLPVQQPMQSGGGAPGTPNLPVQQPAMAQPSGGRTAIQGQSPSLDSAVTQLATDRKSAADLNAGNVPLMDVIRLASKMQANTGKGTPTLNEVRAFMYNAGWLKDSQADATTVYQELNKKLKQVAGNQPGANRSDLAAQDVSEANPNAKTQILPALLNVAKDNLAQNRMAIAKTTSFDAKGSNTNPNDYPTHAANFTTSQERDAYKFDTLPKDQQTKLLKDKLDAAKITIVNGEPVMGQGGDKNAIKFIKSLALARKQKLLNYSE